MATFNFTPATELEAQNVKVDGKGITGEPVFYQDGSTNATVGVLTVRDSDNKVVHAYRVVVNGKNLAVSLEERTGPVKSKYEAQLVAVPPK